MPSQFDRRVFLRRGVTGAAGLVVVGGPLSALLAACGSDDDSSSSDTSSGGAVDFGTLDFQLSWIKNVEFAGEYIADTKGYFTDAGFSGVNLISGGANVTQDAVVNSGTAFVCYSAPDITASAIAEGAELIALGALYQKNPFAVMSLASNPIATPEDMVGKKIGVQSTNETVWSLFLAANDLDPSSIEKVPAQFDPTPLVNGEVDGWFSFITNEPNVLKVQGIETVTFLLNDYNYPLVSQILVVRKESVENERDAVKAMLVACIKGWRDSLVDPSEGAELAANVYGADLELDAEEQTLESEAQNELILTADTEVNGILTMTDELMAETMGTIELAGIDVTQDELFDLSVLAEVYEENPDLKASPV